MEFADRKLFMASVKKWNKKKCLGTFINLYHFGFRNDPNPFFRVWRIIRNTFNGRYEEIEKEACNQQAFML